MSEAYADPDCPDCGGMGFIYGASMLDGGRSCHCMLDALRLQNMEKIWPSLASARELAGLREKPPLKALLKRNAWITAARPVFRAHLKALAFNQSPMWDARVFTDLDVVETWLKTAKAQGHKIYDSEVDNHENNFVAMDIGELVTTYDLVIFKLGVKQAPNKETHSTLLEAMAIRQHLGKPVWIVDAPDQPIIDAFHKAYSERLEGILNHWVHVELIGYGARLAQAGTEENFDPVGDPNAADRLLDVPKNADAAVTDALQDLGEPKKKSPKKKAQVPEVEELEEEEVDEGEEEEEEEEEDLNPMLQQLLENEQRAEQQSWKKKGAKKRSFGKGRKKR